jgi:hypothetical protein
MWTNKRTRRVCIAVRAPCAISFEAIKQQLCNKYKNIRFIALSKPVQDQDCIKHNILFIQFSESTHTSSLEKMLGKMVSSFAFSDYGEPYEIDASWGSFFFKGRRYKESETPEVSKRLLSKAVCEREGEKPRTDLEIKLQTENTLLKALLQQKQGNNIIINNIDNSTTTINVTINNYNKETYNHIGSEDLKKIVSPYCNQWNTSTFVQLTADWGAAVYANPANRNIKCRTKDLVAQVFVDGTWIKLPRVDLTVETFHNLVSSLKEHGSHLYDNGDLTDTNVVVQCVVTGDSNDLHSEDYNRKKDKIVCDIIAQSK